MERGEVRQSQTIYLLICDEGRVWWSKEKAELQAVLGRFQGQGLTLPHHEILEITVSRELVERLHTLKCPAIEPQPLDEVQKGQLRSHRLDRDRFLKNRPQWHIDDGLRVFVVFMSDGTCEWCPSGNAIQGDIDRSLNPSTFLSGPLRLNLTMEQDADLMAFVDWASDNF